MRQCQIRWENMTRSSGRSFRVFVSCVKRYLIYSLYGYRCEIQIFISKLTKMLTRTLNIFQHEFLCESYFLYMRTTFDLILFSHYTILLSPNLYSAPWTDILNSENSRCICENPFHQELHMEIRPPQRGLILADFNKTTCAQKHDSQGLSGRYQVAVPLQELDYWYSAWVTKD